jgi:NADH dehydrogenase FAD-containing subunit
MPGHLVIAGCGHAHLELLAGLSEIIRTGRRVTVINPSRYLYYSGMGPGLVSGAYRPREARFNVRAVAERSGAEFIEDAVTGVDPDRRALALKSNASVAYDIVSFDIGSIVPASEFIGDGDALEFPVKPISRLCLARERIVRKASESAVCRILVVGGGPSGVEIAGNAWRLGARLRSAMKIRVVCAGRLLSSFPERAGRLALASLSSREIDVDENVRVEALQGGTARTSDGRDLAYDAAFIATGVTPGPLFRSGGPPAAEDGGLLVNEFLQCPAHPEIFGGGDCIGFGPGALAKVGVHAVRQAPVLKRNLIAALNGEALLPYRPRPNNLMILNMGDGTGLGVRGGISGLSQIAMRLKEFIDRRFMRRYQTSGELDEEDETFQPTAPSS